MNSKTDQANGEPNDQNKIHHAWYWLPFAVVILLWLITPLVASLIWKFNSVEGRFEAVGALFSGGALAGVVVAIILQRHELELQRQELKLTREEFQEQTTQLESQNKTMQEAARYELLSRLVLEYRSPEMLECVESLWAFHAKEGPNFVKQYMEDYERDRVHIGRLGRSHIHSMRRFVSQFYALLSGLIESRVIPEEDAYAYWGESDLRIIQTILLPIEEALRKYHGPSPSPSATLDRLQRLYDEHPHRPAK